MPWNPNSPDTTGLEWVPYLADTVSVGAEGSAYAITWEAEASRPVAALGAALQPTSPGDWTMELYTEANYLAAMGDASAVQHAASSPTADLHVHPATWSWPADTPPYYQWLVGAPGTPGNANHVVMLSAAKAPYTDAFYAGRYSGLAIPAGQRLLAVRLLHDRTVWNQAESANVAFLEYGFADPNDGSGRITSEERYGAAVAARQTVEYTFRPRAVLTATNHAAALAAWAGAGSGWGLFLNSYSGSNLQLDSWHQQLVADYVPERRLAYTRGTMAVGPLANRWGTLVLPAGAPANIVAGTRYVLVLRGAKYDDAAPFVARLGQLTGGPPIEGYVGGRVRVTAGGLPAQVVPQDSVGAPLYTATTTGAAPTLAVDNDPFPLQGVSPVLGDVTARQQLVVDVETLVGQVVVQVARAQYAGASPLMVRITNDADPRAPIGGAMLLTPERWDQLPNPYTLGGRQVKNVRLDLASPVTLAPGTYWIEATNPDTLAPSSVVPWGLLYLEGLPGATIPDPPGTGFVPAGVLGGRAAAAMLVSQPPTPTGFEAHVVPEVLGVPDGTPCSGRWDTVYLQWDRTTVPDDAFLRYEIERTDNPQATHPTWERIAHIEDPDTLAFADAEARRGRTLVYRLRVMRVDGGTSTWVNASGGPFTMRSWCCGIGFISNDPDWPSLFFQDVEELRTYSVLDADGLVLRPLYGRDYQVAFHPTERRGVQLDTQLLVFAGSPSDGLPTFDALRDMATADLPYVTVLDERGTRLLAALAVPEVRYSPFKELQRYYAQVVATEVLGAPQVLVVARPPEPLPVAGTFHMGDHPNDLLDSNFFLGFS